MVKTIVGIEVFNDPVGQRIKSLLMNYAIDHYEGKPDALEDSIDRTHLIFSFVRQAVIDSMMAEVEVMTFRNANSQEFQIPMLFIAGVLHAVDVASGKGSVIGQVD